MKYSEMTKFLNDNGILVMQPVIANMVDAKIPIGYDMPEEEFEEICDSIYNTYLDVIDEPDVWNLVCDEFRKRGYEDEV